MSEYNKICVYAICKNESQFVDKWINSMAEADYICILDTGSDDNTLELINKYADDFRKSNNTCQIFTGKKVITPWRFDVARNESMKLIPNDTDIFVCTDLDEFFEPGWANHLREKWDAEKYDRVSYFYSWSHRKNGEPARTFTYNKIHGKGWCWKFPVHECLCWENTLNHDPNSYRTIWIDGIHLHHFPDRSKSRSNYLPLLEQRAQEYPEDTFGLIYLCHEYYYRGLYQKSIDLIESIKTKEDFKYFSNIEISSCYLFMGDDYYELENYPEALKNYHISLDYDKTLREPYLKIANLFFKMERYDSAIEYAKAAIKNGKRHYSWLEKDDSWTYGPYDILSLASYYGGHKRDSLAYAYKAYSYDTDNDRLRNNIDVIIKNMSDDDLIL